MFKHTLLESDHQNHSESKNGEEDGASLGAVKRKKAQLNVPAALMVADKSLDEEVMRKLRLIVSDGRPNLKYAREQKIGTG